MTSGWFWLKLDILEFIFRVFGEGLLVSYIPINGFLKNANAAFEAGAFHDAAIYYQAALELDPDNIDVCAQLGIALARGNEFERAQEFLIKALDSRPNNAIFLNVLAFTYGQTGNFQEAEVCYRKLLRFGGGDDLTLSNLGSSLNEMGRFDEAERMFRTSLRRQPDHAVSRYNLGLLELLKGNLEQGWQGFELRNFAKGIAEKKFPDAVRWQGEPVDGRIVLLYAEQGLGDTIQFARYAILLAARGAHVVIQCDAALADLMMTIDGVSQAGELTEVLGGIDFYISLLSLPLLFDTSVTSIPDKCPYLTCSPDIPDAALLIDKSRDTKLRVGLVWAGNPKHQSDRTRSMKLKMFEPVLSRAEIDVYSLQVGDSAAEIDLLKESVRPNIMFQEKRPLNEVASVMKHLDLVISVDTSLSHLAGALGVQVWTLISFYPDWRWMLERTDSPWYPSMRLFRQPVIGDWNAVIQEVGDALDELILIP